MLSGEELFKLHQDATEKTVPQKGGSKGYMPESTWLENKCLENFHTEREGVLSEPRVFRPCDIVQGELNTDKGLVEIHHDMKNFWKHSGFTYEKRKWLYPEEALYLMETNVLQVSYRGLPLSIQQAYGLLIGAGMTLEFYQVYAHLKRMEYVVVRHQGRCEVTRYEKKIGLDKYLHGTRKERKKAARFRKDQGPDTLDVTSSPSPSKKLSMEVSGAPTGGESIGTEGLEDRMEAGSGENRTEGNIGMKDRMEAGSDHQTEGNIGITDRMEAINGDTRAMGNIGITDRIEAISGDNHTVGNTEVEFVGSVDNGKVCIQTDEDKMLVERETDEHGNEAKKEIELETNTEVESRPESEDLEMKPDTRALDNTSTESIKFSESSDTSHPSPIPKVLKRVSGRNFDDILFPDFGTMCTIRRPDRNLHPDKIDLCQDEYTFDTEKMLNKKKFKWRDRDFESDSRLNYSYSVLMSDFAEANRECKNWAEYKAFMKRKKVGYSRPYTEADEGGVAPLVQPEKAFSTRAILDKLHIIEEADFPPLSEKKPDLLPDFDVYKGDTNFAKTCPGMPDHRVCVARCGEPMPGLQVTTAMTSYLRDGVPVYWAVVDHGSIAFYETADFTLPVDINLG